MVYHATLVIFFSVGGDIGSLGGVRRECGVGRAGESDGRSTPRTSVVPLSYGVPSVMLLWAHVPLRMHPLA